MTLPKKYDSYKECIIYTVSDEFCQIFTSDWSFGDIRVWMLDNYSIDESTIIEIKLSSVNLYKTVK